MRQPEPSGLCRRRQRCRLRKGHMPRLLRARLFVRVRKHPLADKQIGVLCHLRNQRQRAGIGDICHAQPAARLSHHHLSGIGHAVKCHLPVLLNGVPCGKRHTVLLRQRGVEFPRTGKANPVPVAGYTVGNGKGSHRERGERRRNDGLFPFGIPDLEGQFGRDHTQAFHHMRTAFGSRNRNRLRPPLIAHGKEQSGKPGDMVGVKMRQKNGVNPAKRQSARLDADLHPLAAVNEQFPAVMPHEQSGQPPVFCGHGSARTHEYDFKHACAPPFLFVFYVLF
ncbi:unknown [Clostridium sp. CAG:448]|nr:unknown [Clostridium sp. CAG:448]